MLRHRFRHAALALPLVGTLLLGALLVGTPLVGACRSARAADEVPVQAQPSAGEVARLLDGVLPLDQRCELRYLLHLGWRFERDASVKDVVVAGGRPCRYRTLARAQAAGSLRIQVPSSFGAVEARALGARLAEIADGRGSRCAYKHKVAPAVQRAVKRFDRGVETGRYQFPELFDLVHSPWWAWRLPEPQWEKRGRVYVATTSAARALESIWSRGAIAECYAGQWLAVFGTQYELYGREAFDEAFAPEDLQIGAPQQIKPAPVGRYTRGKGPYPWRGLLIPLADQRKDPILVLGPHGPMAFVGLTGIMRNQDRDVTTNENFLIARMSPAALKQLVDGGGLAFLRREARAIWSHVNPCAGFLRLGGPKGEHAREVDRILAQPAFSEVWVYGHPHGIVPFAFLVRKMFSESSSPVEFMLYLHGREDFLYQRYRRVWKARCARGIAEPVPLHAVPAQAVR